MQRISKTANSSYRQLNTCTWGYIRLNPGSRFDLDCSDGQCDIGFFILTVEDNGEPGVSQEDYFKIQCVGGVFGDYINEGVLASGNIQVH